MLPVDNDVIALLNTALKNKLTSINQYFLHARMLKHQGHVKLADYEYKASIDAMKHSDMLVEHILAMGGAPQLQELGKLMIGNTPDEMLRCDLRLAEAQVAQAREALAFCENRKDQASAALLKKIIENRQETIEFLRGQLGKPAAA